MTWRIVGDEIHHEDGDRWCRFDSHSNAHDFTEELLVVCDALNGVHADRVRELETALNAAINDLENGQRNRIAEFEAALAPTPRDT